MEEEGEREGDYEEGKEDGDVFAKSLTRIRET
jgi:hypothetical protein